MEEYIVVRPDLTVAVAKTKPRLGVGISLRTSGRAPAVWRKGKLSQNYVARFRDLLGDIRSQDHFEATGQRICFLSSPPEPWLIALLIVIWEGVLGNATWDGIKYLLGAAMSKMRRKNVVPDANEGGGERVAMSAYLDFGQLFKVYLAFEKEKIDYEEHPNWPSSYKLPRLDDPPQDVPCFDPLVAPDLDPPRPTKKTPKKKRKPATKKPVRKKAAKKKIKKKRKR